MPTRDLFAVADLLVLLRFCLSNVLLAVKKRTVLEAQPMLTNPRDAMLDIIGSVGLRYK